MRDCRLRFNCSFNRTAAQAMLKIKIKMFVGDTAQATWSVAGYRRLLCHDSSNLNKLTVTNTSH